MINMQIMAKAVEDRLDEHDQEVTRLRALLIRARKAIVVEGLKDAARTARLVDDIDDELENTD